MKAFGDHLKKSKLRSLYRPYMTCISLHLNQELILKKLFELPSIFIHCIFLGHVSRSLFCTELSCLVI